MTMLTPEAIRDLRKGNPTMQGRDLARENGLSEAELVAAQVGVGAVRLVPDVPALLDGMPDCGEVMIVTRNQTVVHKKIGTFEKPRRGRNTMMVLGSTIDLRIFWDRWAHGFAVEDASKQSAARYSMQFFDSAGDAVFKIFARPTTNMEAWQAMVGRLTAPEQTPVVVPVQPADEPARAGAPAGREELVRAWEKLTDTHQFRYMLKRLNLSRIEAINMIGESYARPVPTDAAALLLQAVAAEPELKITVFVFNPGCYQVHAGLIRSVSVSGPWLKVNDETFRMRVRMEDVRQAWVVRKPVAKGHVTTLDCYDAEGRLVVQFFGKRVEGYDEHPRWRALLENLPRLNPSNAA